MDNQNNSANYRYVTGEPVEGMPVRPAGGPSGGPAGVSAGGPSGGPAPGAEPAVRRRRGVPVAVFIICLFLALFLGAGATFGAVTLVGLPFHKTSSSKVDNEKIALLQRQIDMYYLNDYDQENLVEGAYRGYVEGLDDPYSDYMTKEDLAQDELNYSDHYSGVGITFEEDEKGGYVVVSVSGGSPAEKAGVKAGDYLLTVNGKTYTNINDMAKDIRGEKGTEVTLEILQGKEKKEITMVRDDIKQESVKSEVLDGGIGYIRIGSFIESTGADFDKALQDVSSKGAKSLILDLRDNGGGLVDDSVHVADAFLDEGVITYVQDKNGKTETYDAKDGKTGLKTVVLVNEYSASASEILAGAMKDNGYEIIGEKTYGKGVIQVTMPLADGSAVKLTCMEYLTPDKHKVNKEGIEPTVEVEEDEDTDADEQLDKAKELLK